VKRILDENLELKNCLYAGNKIVKERTRLFKRRKREKRKRNKKKRKQKLQMYLKYVYWFYDRIYYID
jgi:hypothetical protein